MDYISTRSQLEFVRDQLGQYAGAKKDGPDSTFIICPFHSEKTPSGRVFHGETTKAPGWFRCYGCGASKSWNTVAPMIGLKPFKREKPVVEHANFNLLPGTETPEDVAEEMVFSKVPKNKVWREIPTNLLIALGAKICRVRHPDHGLLKPKLWLPVYVKGDLKGYIKARMRKHPDYPSYINARGGWSKTHGLFPYDYAIELAATVGSKAIVLVEGQRDALRLLNMGIPAVCILGTQSWSATKAKLLELGDVEHVILLLDGDCAGIEATQMLKPKLEEMFRVTTLKLWRIKGSPYIPFKDEEEPSKAAKAAGTTLWDPGNCPEWILKKIKRKYFGG